MDAAYKPLAEPRQQNASPRASSGFMPCLHFLFQLREDVASCQPLATALDNGRVILCDRIADPWVRILSRSLRGGLAGTCMMQYPTTN